MVRYVLITPWCPMNKLEWYKAMILSAHISGMANTATSFSGVTIILNNIKSNNIYFSANASTFLISTLELGKMLWDKYRYISLKYILVKYFAWISFNVMDKCEPLSTLSWIIFKILSMSVCFDTNFCTILLVSTKLSKSFSSWK